MRYLLLTLMATGFILAMSSIGCRRDNTAVINDRLSEAERLKENGDEQKAMEVLLDAARRIDDDTPLNIRTRIYTQFGALFYDNYKIEDAGRYFQKAVDTARLHDSIASYPNLLWNLVLTVTDTDSIKKILSECRDLSDLDRDKYGLLALRSRLNLAKLHVITGDTETAKSILDSIYTSVQADHLLKTESIMERALLYLAEDDLEEGVGMLQTLSGDSLSLEGNTERYNMLYKAHTAMGDYREALNYRDSLATCMDSIQSIKSAEQISRIEKEYDQRIEKEKRELNTILYTGCAIVVLLSILIFMLNRDRRMKARQVSLVEQISNLNLELSRLKEKTECPANTISDAIISKLRLSRELFATLPQYSLIAQANLQQNAEDIPKEIQKELFNGIVAHFSDLCNNLKDEYPALSPDDMMLGIMTYVGMNKDVVSVLLRSSDDALRQRKSRMKKKIPAEVFDLFFCKTT